MACRGRRKVAFGTLAFAVWNIAFGTPAQASPESDLRDLARKTATEMRSKGMPQTRCSTGARLEAGRVVSGEGVLKPGDRLLYLNNHDVQNASDDDIIAMLNGIPPDAIIPIRVDRGGEQTDLQLQCVNAAVFQTTYLSALDLAGRKKFDDCVAALAAVAEQYGEAAALRYQCAATSDDAKNYDLARFADEVLKQSIAVAQYKPAVRREVLQTLRANQGVLRPAAYQALVDATKRWPGDETLFDDTQPDWNRYRDNAEAALVSTMFDPGSAQIEWPYGFLYGTWRPVLQRRIEGYWTCGRINGKNRMGGYVGSRYFVVVMGHNAEVLYTEMATGDDYDFLEAGCSQSVHMLPPGSSQFAVRAKAEFGEGRSVAEELAQLSQLRSSGALTEEEFQAAKAKVLGTD